MEKSLPFPPSEIKAVVYDIDGVLIDSTMSIVAQAGYWVTQLDKRSSYGSWDDIYRLYEANKKSGDPAKVMREVLQCSDEEWEQNKDSYMAIHEEGFQLHKNLMVPHLGAAALVQDTAKVKKTAAFTSRKRVFFTPQTVPYLLPPAAPDEDENPHGLFHITITADDVTQLKPDPEGLFTIMEYFKKEPNEVLMIGDSPTDIIAGKRAGVRTMAIAHLGAFANQEVLRQTDPDVIVSSLQEVRDIIL